MGLIWDAFAPHRDDFKAFLREVRRNNKNTLSGLSLDTIAQQVKGIIDQRDAAEKKQASRKNPPPQQPPLSKGKVPAGKTRPVEKKVKV